MWYNAKIEKILADGTYEVLFVDYGNSDTVGAAEILVAGRDIPEGEEWDECVVVEPEPEKKKFEVGQHVIARWSEDKVWYRAKILEIGSGNLQVVFTDYGNEEKVEKQNIVLCGADIPAEEEDFVDEFVEGFNSAAKAVGDQKAPEGKDGGTLEASEQGKKEQDQGKKYEEVKKTRQASQPGDQSKKSSSGTLPPAPREVGPPIEEEKKEKTSSASAEPDTTTAPGGKLSVNTRCFAKWTEDDVWYNAKVEKVLEDGTFQVLFLDYGNSEVTARVNIVLNWEDIPDEDECDENVIEPSTDSASKDVASTTTSAEKTSKNCDVSQESPRNIFEDKKKSEKIVLVDGQSCLAKWDEDEVWYRATVTTTSAAGVEVLFTDYGNSAVLARERILMSYHDIPAEDVAQEMIDENVVAPPPSAPEVGGKSVVSDKSGVESSVQWAVDDKCIARWEEDQVKQNNLLENFQT